jgi:hypothetical protein
MRQEGFDGRLVNHRQKGNRVEFVGVESVDQTDARKALAAVTRDKSFPAR